LSLRPSTGSRSVEDEAKERAKKILEEHRPLPLGGRARFEIKNIMREKEIFRHGRESETISKNEKGPIYF